MGRAPEFLGTEMPCATSATEMAGQVSEGQVSEGLQSPTLSGSRQPGSPRRRHRRALQFFAKAPGLTQAQQAEGGTRTLAMPGQPGCSKRVNRSRGWDGGREPAGRCSSVVQLEHKVPPGKGASAAVLPPCAKINNLSAKV